jgi:arylsulfatase A-like enzyme
VCQISPKEFAQIIPKVSDLANHAIDWIGRTKEIEPDRPFFCYVAPAATYAPKAWIDKFKGQFDEGWDKYRELTLARQKKLGVVPQDTVLSKRPDSLPAWDTHHAKNAGEVFG